MTKAIYSNKQSSYFTAARIDLIELLPRFNGLKILELGAGTGETLIAAKDLGLAEEVVGIELIKAENSGQTSSKIDRFIYGDIENLALDFEDNYFDVVICADVLEHLVDPWQVVRKLSNHLRQGGLFISSIPNIRNYRVLLEIFLHGSFEYQGSGILDKTHLRFFCKKNIVQMFEDNGYEIQIAKNNMGAYGLRQKLFNNVTFKIFKDFLVFQYCTVAQKK